MCTSTRPHPPTVAALVLGLVLAVACGDRAVAKRQDATDISVPASAPAPMEAQVSGRLAVAADAVAPTSQFPAGQLPRGADSVAPGMIIRNGNVSIQVDSLEVAMATLRALATRLGGYVGNVSTSTGEYAVRSATLELKVPSARFDEAMSGMAPIGKVEQSNATAEDVGEEFVDLTARMANARRLEDRVLNLLATRTGKLEDVLAVERELARVREEIERYEGRLRFLRSRVAMSTLVVTVHEAAPLVSPNPGTSVIGEAFRDMWRNFVNLIAMVIASLGVVIPVALAAFLVWRWVRPRRHSP